jgi:hypothetical protein
MTNEQLAQSNAEMQRARQLLTRPNPTPEELHEAFLALATRSIAEQRAYQMRLNAAEPGRLRTLSADDLRGMCNAGRDITTEALITAIGNSPHEIRIERLQASHLGIKGDRLDPQHGFAIVTLPDGSRFLIDPTFAQFADRTSTQSDAEWATRSFTAENMLNTREGSALARDLIRDGMVPLTEDALRQYMIGLGADLQGANAAAARVVSGGATVVTEIVRNGRVEERFVGRPEGVGDINTASDQDAPPMVRIQSMIESMTEDNPARPLLISLRNRLDLLALHLPELPDTD